MLLRCSIGQTRDQTIGGGSAREHAARLGVEEQALRTLGTDIQAKEQSRAHVERTPVRCSKSSWSKRS